MNNDNENNIEKNLEEAKLSSIVLLNNGILEELDYEEKNDPSDKVKGCICFDCENCSPLKCIKVASVTKKHISSYDFITDGYQIINENGDVVKFCVNKCNDFVEDDPKKREADYKNARKAALSLAEGAKYDFRLRSSEIEVPKQNHNGKTVKTAEEAKTQLQNNFEEAAELVNKTYLERLRTNMALNGNYKGKQRTFTKRNYKR